MGKSNESERTTSYAAEAARLVAVGLALLGAGLCVGCGDDGGGAPARSGIAGDTLLTELTDAEARELCRFREHSYKSMLGTEQAYCATFGISAANSSEECEQFEQECLDGDAYQRDVNEDWECDAETAEDVIDPDSGCTATVADYEACIEARGQGLMDWAANVACDAPASLDQPDWPLECGFMSECYVP